MRYLEETQPDMALVQGDTTTVFTATLCCFYRGIPVGHVEAGLRTGKHTLALSPKKPIENSLARWSRYTSRQLRTSRKQFTTRTCQLMIRFWSLAIQ